MASVLRASQPTVWRSVPHQILRKKNLGRRKRDFSTRSAAAAEVRKGTSLCPTFPSFRRVSEIGESSLPDYQDMSAQDRSSSTSLPFRVRKRFRGCVRSRTDAPQRHRSLDDALQLTSHTWHRGREGSRTILLLVAAGVAPVQLLGWRERTRLASGTSSSTSSRTSKCIVPSDELRASLPHPWSGTWPRSDR